MTNFIFKSPRRLVKKSDNTPMVNLNILGQLKMLLTEQRLQRSDLKTINDKLDRLMVDKHLQMQVDEYFQKGEQDGT